MSVSGSDLPGSSTEPILPSTAPPELLKETQAAKEIQRLQLNEVADILQALVKTFDHVMGNLNQVLDKATELTKGIQEMYDLHMEQLRLEITWFQSIQGEFRIEEVRETPKQTVAASKEE